MSLLLYGISDTEAPAVDEVGVDGRPLRFLRGAGLTAVVGAGDGAPADRSTERLRAYAHVVERLAERCTILPARFGSTLADEAGVKGLLRDRREQLTTAVAHVRGAVELSVRALWRQRLETEADDGLTYMTARLELRRRAREVAAALEPLDTLARERVVRMLPTPELPMAGAYLVERGRVREFAQAVQRLDEKLEQAELLCTGPWPPYSFAAGAPA